jgi:hypothetical protein
MSLKNKVYYQKSFDPKKVKSNLLTILKDRFVKDKDIYVKMHFGEPGNEAAFRPEDVRPIVEALEELDLHPILIDTPVKYDSPRNNVEGHSKVVKDKGYHKISDFLISDDYVEVKMKDLTVEVCKELAEAENVLVLSHVKGHPCSGFGGAIKNLGMGGVSPKSKGDEHDMSKPEWTKECHGCRTCAKLCPAGAITMKPLKKLKKIPGKQKPVTQKAVIDLDKCYGCSICEIACPHDCLAPRKAIFDDLLAQGASACIKRMPKNTFYINWIKNIAKHCDCAGDCGGIIGEDVGLVYSENPLAIDEASVDLVEEKNGENVFKKANYKDPKLQIVYAAENLNFKPDYELEKLD